ncbi:MAG: SDR family NAD(P)-dependent oxidoreductase [Verrucomicrobiae bacterium]|nr:SDR family NAD(P)-dependent oxidoreductase [Verrucomicrobiae bacterium]
MKSTLEDKWVLITGASSGFGAAAARAFGRRGARLLLGARRVDRLAAVADQAMKDGSPCALFHFLDVTATSSVTEYFEWMKSVTSRLDVLINNAGGALGLDPVAEGKDSDWETMFQTNALGILRMVRAALPYMLPYPGGIIINIGSVAGRTAYEGGAAYCGAKAAELQITRALRLELCGTGLRVCTIDPGMAETEFSIVRFKGDTKRAAQVYEGVQPLTAEDVAEAMVWVAERPPHVCVDEMVIKCTDQAAVYKVHRRPTSKSQ